MRNRSSSFGADGIDPNSPWVHWPRFHAILLRHWDEDGLRLMLSDHVANGPITEPNKGNEEQRTESVELNAGSDIP